MDEGEACFQGVNLIFLGDFGVFFKFFVGFWGGLGFGVGPKFWGAPAAPP